MANTIAQTTLSAITTADATYLTVASATNLSAPTNGFLQQIYVINPDSTRGELMNVTALSGTTVSVSRLDLFRQHFVSGAVVLIAPPVTTGALFAGPILGGFQEFNPTGGSSRPQLSSSLQPWLNITTGEQWIFGLSGVWVPGWNNPSTQKGVSAAVASAAGLITPSGPLFHVTGTAAVTGFTIPVGFAGGSFTIIPDAVFTWTAANNIALAGSAVVNKAITFQYDSSTGKFVPSYIA